MFEKHKAHKAGQAQQRLAVQQQQQEAARQHERDVLAWCAATARAVANETAAPVSTPIALKAKEQAIYFVDGAGLVESRRGPGHWQGGSQGVSVRIPGTKSMRYRVGATRGTYAQGDESPTLIDNGSLTITTTRAVFIGAKQTREWAWAKLLGFHDEATTAWTGIAVSNRQKVSGISYPPAQAVAVRFYLELGAAVANGTVDDLIAELDAAPDSGAAPGGAIGSP